MIYHQLLFLPYNIKQFILINLCATTFAVIYTCAIVSGPGNSTCSSQGSWCGWTCADSDDGEDIFVQGYVFGQNDSNEPYVYNDTCVSSDHLQEWYCTSYPQRQGPAMKNALCFVYGMICDNGACVNQTGNQTS